VIDFCRADFAQNGEAPGIRRITKVGGIATNEIDKLDIPPVRELLETLDDSGAELYACRLAADMMGLKHEDFVPQVKAVISAMDFFEKSHGANIIFI
jgi:peroxiredoxin family protein